MRFEKWHALGNAYLLVERPDGGDLGPERVRRLCDVRFGIGADGVLEVTARDDTRATVRIWNPDGSTAELSGNGTRIAAAWLLRESGASDVEIDTGTPRRPRVRDRSRRDRPAGAGRDRRGARRGGRGRRRTADDRPGRHRQSACGCPPERALARRPAASRPCDRVSSAVSASGRTSSSRDPSRATSSRCSSGSAARGRRRRPGRRPPPSPPRRSREGGSDSPVRVSMPGGSSSSSRSTAAS